MDYKTDKKAKKGSNSQLGVDPLKCYLQVRCTKVEYEKWGRAAKGPMSPWVRQILNKATGATDN